MEYLFMRGYFSMKNLSQHAEGIDGSKVENPPENIDFSEAELQGAEKLPSRPRLVRISVRIRFCKGHVGGIEQVS